MEYHTTAVTAAPESHVQPQLHQFQAPAQPSSPSPYPATYRTANSPHHPEHSQKPQATQDGSHNIYSEPPRSTMTPSTPSQTASPRFSNASPGQQSRQLYLSTTQFPAGRSLPNPDAITSETIASAYATFVLYCNPSFPLTTPTEELKRVFSQPPRSEGKSFDTYRLFELISRLEKKDIKTWTELALELGVEKADLEKGQSSQKVGQYTVRLKRWMKALHIDAFFDYLNDKSPPYLKQIPGVGEPLPDHRDGVPIEEDLAIRALDPKFRPKRGRRKADEMQEDDMLEPQSAIEPKRPHLDTSYSTRNGAGGYPHSAFPGGVSAHPDNAPHDPWSSASIRQAEALRWRASDPQTPHPLSAITPMSAHPDSAYDNEPQSAITPRARSRRRHGPAVSSAWPSSGVPGSGRLRGRPPANRSVRDGPFVTFPVDPGKEREGGLVDMSRGPSAPPSDSIATETTRPPSGPLLPQPSAMIAPPSRPASQLPSGRPDRLQLQVPVHTGNPVQLVTPTLLVNGTMSSGPPRSMPLTQTATPVTTASLLTASSTPSRYGLPAFGHHDSKEPTHEEESAFLTPRSGIHRPFSAINTPISSISRVSRDSERSAPDRDSPRRLPLEILKRALAADLLRGEVVGRQGKKNRLRGVEAKLLAEAILARMHAKPSFAMSPPDPSSTIGEESQRNFTAATWLGLSLPSSTSSDTATQDPTLTNPTHATDSLKRITVQRFRVGRDGYDSPVDDDDSATSQQATPPLRRDSDGEIRECFDVEWAASMGGVTGRFAIRGLSFSAAAAAAEAAGGLESISEEGGGRSAMKGSDPRGTGGPFPPAAAAPASKDEEILAWRARALEAERRARVAREEIGRLKEGVLDVVL